MVASLGVEPSLIRVMSPSLAHVQPCSHISKNLRLHASSVNRWARQDSNLHVFWLGTSRLVHLATGPDYVLVRHTLSRANTRRIDRRM